MPHCRGSLFRQIAGYDNAACGSGGCHVACRHQHAFTIDRNRNDSCGRGFAETGAYFASGTKGTVERSGRRIARQGERSRTADIGDRGRLAHLSGNNGLRSIQWPHPMESCRDRRC